MDLMTVAVVIIAILLGFAVFKFLGGCLIRLILLGLIVAAVIFVVTQLI